MIQNCVLENKERLNSLQKKIREKTTYDIDILINKSTTPDMFENLKTKVSNKTEIKNWFIKL